MKTRSPALGYNHNVRYAGRLWHVQTEDSGVQNPHVFTHLFHEGTILATKRIDYDPAEELPAVQRLMQTQHKAMLRELKAGAFDDKIGKFFGEPVDKNAEESTDPNARSPIATDLPGEDAVPAELPATPTERNLEARPVTAQPRPAPAPAPTRSSTHAAAPAPSPPTGERITASRSTTAGRSVTGTMRTAAGTARPVTGSVGGIGSRRLASSSSAVNRPSAEGVVVARPAVIVGSEPPRPTPPPARRTGASQKVPVQPPAPAAPAAAGNDSIFGADLISEKSLDEVILAYLSEDITEK